MKNIAQKAFEKHAGIWSATGHLAARTVEAPFYGTYHALKGVKNMVQSFGSTLTNDVSRVAENIEEGSKLIGKGSAGASRVAPVELYRDPTLSDHIRALALAHKKIKDGKTIDGIADIVDAGPKALNSIDPGIRDAVVERITRKSGPKIDPAILGAAGAGGLGLGYMYGSKKEAGVLSLKTKLKMLFDSKPKIKHLVAGGLVGAGLGTMSTNLEKNADYVPRFPAQVYPKAPSVPGPSAPPVPLLPGSTPSPVRPGLWGLWDRAKNLVRTKPAIVDSNVTEAARTKWEAKNPFSENGIKLDENLKSPESYHQSVKAHYHTDQFKDYKKIQTGSDPDRLLRAAGRAAGSKSRYAEQRLLRIANIGSSKFLAGANLSPNNKAYAGLAAGIGGMFIKRKAENYLANRAMMNTLKKWGPVGALGAGAFMLARNKNNDNQKQAGFNPINAARNAFKKVLREAKAEATQYKPVINPRTGMPAVEYVDEISEIGGMARPTGVKYPYTPVTPPKGYTRYYSDKLKDIGSKYGPYYAAAGLTLSHGKKLFDFGRSHYLARKAAQQEAKELKYLAGAGVAAAGTIAALNAYNAHMKEASTKEAGAKEDAIARILSRTPRATNIEEAIAHWAGKREQFVSKLDDLGEANFFNAGSHARATRALNEAEGNLAILHKVNLGEASAAAPTPASGVTLKGLALGGGLGALGMAAYIKKQNDNAEQIPMQYYNNV